MLRYIKLILICITSLFILNSCDTGLKKLFSNQTAREKYADKVEKNFGLAGTAWLRAADTALKYPAEIELPYSERGYFLGDSADVVALRFQVNPGQAVKVALNKISGNYTVFTELWEQQANTSPRLLSSADTTENAITENVLSEGEYILRVQPAVKDSGSFTIAVSTSPLFRHPIDSSVSSYIGSVWGDDRDAGARRHEGIDIFAKKGSDVVAVEDGYVRRVGDGGIGGKVIWFSPKNYRLSVYYAHLDSQYVQAGQQVKKGDRLGAVGNTGNARYTPSHLHFGIYTGGGAINPINFIKIIKPSTPPASFSRSGHNFMLKKGSRVYPSPERKNAVSLTNNSSSTVRAATGNYFRITTDSSRQFFIPSAEVK